MYIYSIYNVYIYIIIYIYAFTFISVSRMSVSISISISVSISASISIGMFFVSPLAEDRLLAQDHREQRVKELPVFRQQGIWHCDKAFEG